MPYIIKDVETVNHIRSAFLAAGYRPVTLYSDPPDRRKHPVDTEWQDHARRTPSPYATNQATRFAANTGILCDGLRAVDIDVDDAAMVAEIISLAESMLGAAPLKYRENSPRVTLPYRAAEGEPPKRSIQNRNTGHKIEVLGRGQQFLAHGIHDSGVPIQWTGLKPRDELTAVTEDQITAFLAAAREIIGADESGSSGCGNESEWRAGDLSAVDAALLESIYARMPNHGRFDDRNEWIKLAHATAAAFRRDLWRGRRLFLAHAERFHGPVKEGEADRVWASVTSRDRADQPIPDDAISPHRAGAGYLVQMARETGVEPALIAAYESAVLLHEGFMAEARPEGAMPDMDAMADKAQREQDERERTAFFDRLGVWDAGDDDYQIAPRQWLLGNVFCRQFLSSLLADGGVGKTATRLAQLISLATGRSLTGETVHRRCRVLILSLEDGRDELRRRVYAVMRHHHITPAEVQGWLLLAAPKGLKLMEKDADGNVRLGKLGKYLGMMIDQYKPDVVSLDPFVKSHSLGESDNSAIDDLCTFLADMAITYDCAIDLPHHTRKGVAAAGDADMGRGASAMKDAARLVYTLTRMTPDEAKQFGLDDAERRSLIRMDPGKVNITPPAKDAKWFRLVGVPLGNGTGAYPLGDSVQTVVPWLPPNVWAGVSTETACAILDDIEAGLPNGARYSNHHLAADRGAWHPVQKHLPGHTDKQAREMVATWIENGILERRDYDDPETRKERQGLFLVAGMRPGD